MFSFLKDNGSPVYSSEAIISIHLIDIDNLDPKFSVSSSYNLNISIDTEIVMIYFILFFFNKYLIFFQI